MSLPAVRLTPALWFVVVLAVGFWLAAPPSVVQDYRRTVVTLADRLYHCDLPQTRPPRDPDAARTPPRTLPLTVVAAPADAVVRVMNIEPRYAPGMRLPPGRYDVEVSAAGYQTQRRWMTLGPAESAFCVRLVEDGNHAGR